MTRVFENQRNPSETYGIITTVTARSWKQWYDESRLELRQALIEMHGNNGSMDGDPPAAMCYTEANVCLN